MDLNERYLRMLENTVFESDKQKKEGDKQKKAVESQNKALLEQMHELHACVSKIVGTTFSCKV